MRRLRQHVRLVPKRTHAPQQTASLFVQNASPQRSYPCRANAGSDFRAKDRRQQPSVTRHCQPPRAKTNAQISNHRELCAASDNVGANCVLTAGLIPLRKISEPVAGDQFGDVASYLLRADQLLQGSQSGRLDFSPETRMICCEATAWWVSLSL